MGFFCFTPSAGLEGFPGAVTAQIVYTLRTGGVFDIDLYAQTNARTPLMLSHHDYWDLVPLPFRQSLRTDETLTDSAFLFCWFRTGRTTRASRTGFCICPTLTRCRPSLCNLFESARAALPDLSPLPTGSSFRQGRDNGHDPHPHRRTHQRHRNSIRLPPSPPDWLRLERDSWLPRSRQTRLRYVLGQLPLFLLFACFGCSERVFAQVGDQARVEE